MPGDRAELSINRAGRVDEPSLADLLVCPVCAGELALADMRRHGIGACRQCLRSFSYDGGVFDLTPVPPPDAIVAARGSVWQKLQENGSVAYERCPEQNLSVGTREDAQAFAAFCGLEGLVLDVGCGPQSMPSYGLNIDGRLVGID